MVFYSHDLGNNKILNFINVCSYDNVEVIVKCNRKFCTDDRVFFEVIDNQSLQY